MTLLFRCSKCEYMADEYVQLEWHYIQDVHE